MIGTDYPFPWTSTAVDHMLSTPGLSDDERIAILGGTAAKLLGIKLDQRPTCFDADLVWNRACFGKLDKHRPSRR